MKTFDDWCKENPLWTKSPYLENMRQAYINGQKSARKQNEEDILKIHQHYEKQLRELKKQGEKSEFVSVEG